MGASGLARFRDADGLPHRLQPDFALACANSFPIPEVAYRLWPASAPGRSKMCAICRARSTSRGEGADGYPLFFD